MREGVRAAMSVVVRTRIVIARLVMKPGIPREKSRISPRNSCRHRNDINEFGAPLGGVQGEREAPFGMVQDRSSRKAKRHHSSDCSQTWSKFWCHLSLNCSG